MRYLRFFSILVVALLLASSLLALSSNRVQAYISKVDYPNGYSNPATINSSSNKTINTAFVGEGWLTSWQYRKAITVNSSTSALTDYQVKVPVAFVNGKMNSNFSDIRFTAADGSTQLTHWLESSTVSASAIYWVKVPSIPATGTTIYVYYGNTTASPASDFENTFIAANNDFELDNAGTLYDSISQWEHSSWTQNDAGTVGGTPSAEDLRIVDSRRYSNSKSVYTYVKNSNWGGNTNPAARHSIQDLYPENGFKGVSNTTTLYIWRSEVSYTTSSRYYWRFDIILGDGVNSQGNLLIGRAWGNGEGVPGNFYDNSDQSAIGSDGQTWYRHPISIPAIFDKSNLVIKIEHQQDSWDDTTADSSFYYDLISGFKLRKFVSPEPVAALGAEVPAPPVPVPGVSDYGLYIMAGLFVAAAFFGLRRIRRTAN